MYWKYYDVVVRQERGTRRRRMGIPAVGEIVRGWVVVEVVPVTGRADGVEAMVVVERVPTKRESPL